MTVDQIMIYAVCTFILYLFIRRFIQRARMKEYSPKQVAGMLKVDSVILLDVRSREERNHQHIEGSVHIPLNEITQKLNSLEKYRGKEIICYCHSGSRSTAAASILTKFGFIASNLKGGMVEWSSLNLR
jgi:rhodanese-related sulfurtransferase